MNALNACTIFCNNFILIIVCIVFPPRKSIVDGLNGNSKRQLTEAAGRKVNPKHPSDLDPDEASNKVTRKLAGTVKTEEKAFDTAEECRRILMLQGGEKGEDKVMQDKVKWEPRNRKREVKRKVFWVRK